MTLANKLKECRKNSGLSQEQLAEKLCVSRQAITKWESGKGLPDISNLQNIAKLFDVSVDYLLDDGTIVKNTLVREPININDYKNNSLSRSKYNAAVMTKYPNAKCIQPLIRSKKLNLKESILDLVQPGMLAVADSINDISAYYLVTLENKQLLVNVTKDFIESKELTTDFTGHKLIIGNNIFKKYSKPL